MVAPHSYNQWILVLPHRRKTTGLLPECTKGRHVCFNQSQHAGLHNLLIPLYHINWLDGNKKEHGKQVCRSLSNVKLHNILVKQLRVSDCKMIKIRYKLLSMK